MDRPESAASSRSEPVNEEDRLFVKSSLNAVAFGLKSFLADYFKSFKIGATIGPRTKDETPFTFEGPAYIVKKAQASLIEKLNNHYPGVEVTFSERLSTKEDRLTKIIINETSSGFKRSISSGEFQEYILFQSDDDNGGQISESSSFEHLIQSMKSLTPTRIIQVIGSCRQALSNTNNVLFTEINKHVNISYENKHITLNVGSCVIWDDFIDLLKKDDRLSIETAGVKGIYHLIDNEPFYVKDLQGLKDGEKYYVETESNTATKLAKKQGIL
jgi:hypothetical protein